MTVSMHRTLAARKRPQATPALIVFVEAILVAMTGNPYFPDPTPSLGTVASALAVLRAANLERQTGTRGTATARNAKQTPVVSLLNRLKAYVQGVADDDPEHAAGIIESAGMSVQKGGRRPKPPLGARPGKGPGKIQLDARAVAREAAYDWAWSTDEGKTWHLAPQTLSARAVLSGLPSGTRCWFRFRATTRKGGTSNWSNPVTFVVP
jgi:hypothetical protein